MSTYRGATTTEHMPENITPESPVERLRTMPAKKIVSWFFHQGILYYEVHKDEATKTLFVEIWWQKDSGEALQTQRVREISETLGRWVWDGWTVQAGTAMRPKPDVVWNGTRFVPRKAYRPGPVLESEVKKASRARR